MQYKFHPDKWKKDSDERICEVSHGHKEVEEGGTDVKDTVSGWGIRNFL